VKAIVVPVETKCFTPSITIISVLIVVELK